LEAGIGNAKKLAELEDLIKREQERKAALEEAARKEEQRLRYLQESRKALEQQKKTEQEILKLQAQGAKEKNQKVLTELKKLAAERQKRSQELAKLARQVKAQEEALREKARQRQAEEARLKDLMAKGNQTLRKYVEAQRRVASLRAQLQDTQARLAQAIQEKYRDLTLNLKVNAIMQALYPKGMANLPSGFAARLRGVFADLVEPCPGPGKIRFRVSGFPLLAPEIAHDLRQGVWGSALVVILAMMLFALFLAPSPLGGLAAAGEACLALLLTVAVAWLSGAGIDSNSATLYLIPVIAVFFLSSRLYGQGKGYRFPEAFALALAAAGLSIVTAWVLPVVRVGMVMSVGLLSTVLVTRVMVRRQDRGLSTK
jgi:hypothetical protein